MFDEVLFEDAEFVSEIKLAIYEAFEAGDITIDEREEFLESIDNCEIPVNESFSNVVDKVKATGSKFANEIKDTSKALNDFMDKVEDTGEDIYDILNKIISASKKDDVVSKTKVKAYTAKAIQLAGKAGISTSELKSDINKLVSASAKGETVPHDLVIKYKDMDAKKSDDKPGKAVLKPAVAH